MCSRIRGVPAGGRAPSRKLGRWWISARPESRRNTASRAHRESRRRLRRHDIGPALSPGHGSRPSRSDSRKTHRDTIRRRRGRGLHDPGRYRQAPPGDGAGSHPRFAPAPGSRGSFRNSRRGIRRAGERDRGGDACMMSRYLCLGWVLCATAAWAQEAESGFELRSTVSVQAAHSPDLTEEPREGAPWVGGFQALLYPTWKLDSHWAVSGAIQIHSRPYFAEEFWS